MNRTSGMEIMRLIAIKYFISDSPYIQHICILHCMCFLSHHYLWTVSKLFNCQQNWDSVYLWSLVLWMQLITSFSTFLIWFLSLMINLFLLVLQVLTAGEMRVGWARPGCLPDKDLGSDDQAFVFDGFKVPYVFFMQSNYRLSICYYANYSFVIFSPSFFSLYISW